MITAVGPFRKSDGTAVVGRIVFTPLSLPALIDGEAFLNNAKSITTDDGNFSVALSNGTWRISFPSLQNAGPVYLIVPPGIATLPVGDLMLIQNSSGTNYRVRNGFFQSWNSDQSAWFPVFITGGPGLEQWAFGAADNSIDTGEVDELPPDQSGLNFRMRGGRIQFWNSDQNAWFAAFVTGQPGAEQWAFGDPDVTP